jgi:Na+/serine symporter
MADSLGIDLRHPAALKQVVINDSAEAVSLMNQWNIKLVSNYH